MKTIIALLLVLSFCNCVQESVINPVEFQEFIIPSSTRVVENNDWAAYYIDTASDDSMFVVESALYDKYKFQKGQIIVIGNDQGILRKITAVQRQDETILMFVDSTSITDAMQRGHAHWQTRLNDIESSIVLYKSNYVEVSQQPPVLEIGFDVVMDDADADTTTTNDQITISGSMRLDTMFDLDFSVDNRLLDMCDWEANINQEVDMSMHVMKACDVNHQVKLVSIQYPGVHFTAGTLPVTMAPIVTVWLGVSGTTNGAAQTSIYRQTFTKVGLQLTPSGVWIPYSDFRNIYTTQGSSVASQANIQSYVTVTVDFPFYQQPGPHVTTRLTQELLGNSTWARRWELYLTAKAEIGIKTAIIQAGLENYLRDDVVAYRKRIAQGP
ncbi:hypothetical protein JW960_09370 [candidate division KSB1 bacterium]|nr:hypothetical protein [candidate division KSB1 bacterium]